MSYYIMQYEISMMSFLPPYAANCRSSYLGPSGWVFSNPSTKMLVDELSLRSKLLLRNTQLSKLGFPKSDIFLLTNLSWKSPDGYDCSRSRLTYRLKQQPPKQLNSRQWHSLSLLSQITVLTPIWFNPSLKSTLYCLLGAYGGVGWGAERSKR